MQGYTAGKERKMDFEVRQVYYSYGKTVALDGLSFSANRGQIVGLIGENGAGKSTVIKSIYRFLPPDKGMILWDGKDIFSLRPDTYPISYIPDTPVFYEELSLLEHLHFTKAVYPQSGASETELLERLDMREHQNKIPSALSKGTRQMLCKAASGSALHKSVPFGSASVPAGRASSHTARWLSLLWNGLENNVRILHTAGAWNSFFRFFPFRCPYTLPCMPSRLPVLPATILPK